jgi:hypothetical protein
MALEIHGKRKYMRDERLDWAFPKRMEKLRLRKEREKLLKEAKAKLEREEEENYEEEEKRKMEGGGEKGGGSNGDRGGGGGAERKGGGGKNYAVSFVLSFSASHERCSLMLMSLFSIR